MTGFSVYYAQRQINDLRGTPQTPPSNLYLALFVADPTDSNITANEISAAWYGRQLVGALAAPTGSGTATSNQNQISFNAVTDNAVTITHWGIYDASTGGNLWMSGTWTTPKVMNVDDVFVVNAGELTLNFV